MSPHPQPRAARLRRHAASLAVAAAFAGLGLAGAPATAHAESLRCNGHSAEVGDSRVSLLWKCGEPALRDSFCAPVFVNGPVPPGQVPQPLPAPLAQAVAGCVVVDEWLYDRGPGHLMATVRLQSGVIQSIRYARSPR